MKTTRFLKHTLVLGAAAGTLVLLARPVLSQQDDQDVMKVIPENYKMLYENALVRVIEARVPPGTEEKPHRHMRGVSISMTEYTSNRGSCPTAHGYAPTASTARSTGRVEPAHPPQRRHDDEPHHSGGTEILGIVGIVGGVGRRMLNASGANLMLHHSAEPFIASQQAIFFYLYVEDVASFRNTVMAAGGVRGVRSPRSLRSPRSFCTWRAGGKVRLPSIGLGCAVLHGTGNERSYTAT